jgi:hypothetical protein
MTLEEVVNVILRKGFLQSHETKKLCEFTGPSGHVVYVYREQSFQSGLQIMIHPELDDSALIKLDGVTRNERFPLRSGSNMRRFPKRQSPDAATPIAYGRALFAENYLALERLLDTLNTLPTR